MESDSETEGEVGLGQWKEMVEEEMFEAFMAKHTFLVEKLTETDQKCIFGNEGFKHFFLNHPLHLAWDGFLFYLTITFHQSFFQSYQAGSFLGL